MRGRDIGWSGRDRSVGGRRMCGSGDPACKSGIPTPPLTGASTQVRVGDEADSGDPLSPDPPYDPYHEPPYDPPTDLTWIASDAIQDHPLGEPGSGLARSRSRRPN